MPIRFDTEFAVVAELIKRDQGHSLVCTPEKSQKTYWLKDYEDEIGDLIREVVKTIEVGEHATFSMGSLTNDGMIVTPQFGVT